MHENVSRIVTIIRFSEGGKKMRRCSEFSLFRIAGIPYLLPFGQGIAEQRRGVRINETGVYLWELLKDEISAGELLTLYTAHYEASDAEASQLKADLHQFLRILDNYGILENFSAPDSFPDSGCSGPDRKYLGIGGLTLLLQGPKEAYSQEFDRFEISPVCRPDQTLTVTGRSPLRPSNGQILLRDSELIVMENALQYIFLFPNAPKIYEARLSKDGATACYYCRPPYTEALRQDLFHAIRLSFLYLAQLHHMAVLHSASLLYENKAWLFSGHSGAGKSTHTNLWKELYGVPLLNGDLNLLSMENGQPVIHGLPWCGTSGIADTGTYPLGGILLVKKAPVNRAAPLSADRAQLLVTQRLISPGWTEALMQKNLSLIEELFPHILICRLYCTREPDAAETAKEVIDNWLNAES